MTFPRTLNPDQYNIVKLIGQYTPLQREGQYYWRGTEYSSLVVDAKRNCFFHNSSGISGDAYDFFTKIMGFSFKKARSIVERNDPSMPTLLRQIERKRKEPVKLPYSLAQEHHQNLRNLSLDGSGYQWWEGRGVHRKVVNRLLLGFWRDDFGTPWYTIPIPSYPDRQYLANYKIRRGCKGEPRYRQWTSGLETHIYIPFPELIKSSNMVVLVAGEIKAIVLGQYGIPVATSSSGVATWQMHWDFVADKEVIICFDPKEHKPQERHGKLYPSNAKRIAEQVLETGAKSVREVVLPHDPDDCIVKHNWHPTDLKGELGLSV